MRAHMSLFMHCLGADPAARGDVDHLVVGAPVLDLIIGASVRTRSVPQIHPPHGGLGARLLQLFAGLVYIVHQETEVIDTGVPGHVSGTLTAALVIGLENSQINVPIGEVVTSPCPAHFLQPEHLFVKGGGFVRVWGAYSDVFDLCHDDLPATAWAEGAQLNGRPSLDVILRLAVPALHRPLATQRQHFIDLDDDSIALTLGIPLQLRWHRARHDLLPQRSLFMDSRLAYKAPRSAGGGVAEQDHDVWVRLGILCGALKRPLPICQRFVIQHPHTALVAYIGYSIFRDRGHETRTAMRQRRIDFFSHLVGQLDHGFPPD